MIYSRCEVTRVLLLLILQPSPQRLTSSLAQVLEKYAWAEENVNNGKIILHVSKYYMQYLKYIRLILLFCRRSRYERG